MSIKACTRQVFRLEEHASLGHMGYRHMIQAVTKWTAGESGQVKVFRALFKYDAQQADELSFEEGDLLYVKEMTGDWWKATCGGKNGLIPSNYVAENAEAIDNPLHEAAKRGNMGLLSECLTNKVSVNSLDKAGSTPLHWAAHGGHMECLTMLLQTPRCEVNVQNKLGDTPLHSAAWKGHPAAVAALLEKAARIDLRNNEGKTAYDLAKEPQTASLLQQAVRPQRYSEEYGDEEDSD